MRTTEPKNENCVRRRAGRLSAQKKKRSNERQGALVMTPPSREKERGNERRGLVPPTAIEWRAP